MKPISAPAHGAAPTRDGDDARVVPVFDGHNDLLTTLQWPGRAGARDPYARNAAGHLDLPRMREGGMVGGFFSAFVPSRTEPNDFAAHTGADGRYRLPLPEPIEPDTALRHVLAMVARLHRLADASHGALRVVGTADEARHVANEGAIAAALHLEGADAIDRDLDALLVLERAGLRALAPAWSRPNAFAHGVPLAYPATPDLGPGLTDAGRALVRACDELGLLVDVSHLTEAGFWDVLDVASGPVVASHSNAHAVCPHARNLTDAQLDALAERGGVVGVNFGAGFLDPEGTWREDLGLDVVVRHVDHLVDRLGVDGVALGSDFEGARVPSAIGDATGLPAVVGALREGGYDAPTIDAIAHANWWRVWKEVRPR